MIKRFKYKYRMHGQQNFLKAAACVKHIQDDIGHSIVLVVMSRYLLYSYKVTDFPSHMTLCRVMLTIFKIYLKRKNGSYKHFRNLHLACILFFCSFILFIYNSIFISMTGKNIPSSTLQSLPTVLVLLLWWAVVVVAVVKAGCGVGFLLFVLEDLGSDDLSSLSFTSIHKFKSMLLCGGLDTTLSQTFEELSKDVSAAWPFLLSDSAARLFFFPLQPATLLEVADFRSLQSWKHSSHSWLYIAVK